MAENKEKALALYSGGLDSRLIIKLLKEKGVDVTAIHYQLPFISDKEINDDFLEKESVELKVIDCKKGADLQEYLKIMIDPKYGVGAGVNPCIDCKIYMFERARQYAKENGYDYLATGEVPGQRPMSQLKKAQQIITEDVDFPIVRPLAEIGLHGRSRDPQMKMVKEMGDFNYPTPGGGCLLCEKGLKTRFQKYLHYDLITEDTLHLMNVGRHFLDESAGFWFIVARDGVECELLEKFDTVLSSAPKTPAVFYYNITNENNDIVALAKKLQTAYITGQNKALREQFSNVKL